MPKFSIMEFDDWSVLYVDGKVQHQGHSVDECLRELAKLSPEIDYRYIDYDDPLAEVLERTGYFPETLAEAESIGGEA